MRRDSPEPSAWTNPDASLNIPLHHPVRDGCYQLVAAWNKPLHWQGCSKAFELAECASTSAQDRFARSSGHTRAPSPPGGYLGWPISGGKSGFSGCIFFGAPVAHLQASPGPQHSFVATASLATHRWLWNLLHEVGGPRLELIPMFLWPHSWPH